jgi:hypothetical protein
MCISIKIFGGKLLRGFDGNYLLFKSVEELNGYLNNNLFSNVIGDISKYTKKSEYEFSMQLQNDKQLLKNMKERAILQAYSNNKKY